MEIFTKILCRKKADYVKIRYFHLSRNESKGHIKSIQSFETYKSVLE